MSLNINSMEERLKEAAKEGNINSLYALIGEKEDILDQTDEKPFVDAPLHVSAFHGKTQFAMEIMRLKPSFARKLNKDGFSSIHLALQNDQTRTILQLLEVDTELARFKGKGGITPLHHAAKTGNTFLLCNFLSACPKSIEDVNNQNETALHIAIKNEKIEAFKILVEALMEFSDIEDACYRERLILTRQDEQGQTICNIAYKLSQDMQAVGVDSGDLRGFTALDIKDDQPPLKIREITEMRCSIGQSTQSIDFPTSSFKVFWT